MIKSHKRKKSSRQHGRHMGTHGTGARKNKRESGNRGGFGMSGSGKRADHKKTLITKLYGHGYFGKKGITSKKTEKDKRLRISLSQIQSNLESYGKKTAKGWEIDLSKYKLLGKVEVKEKLFIKALEASKGAIESVKKAGGEIILPEKKVSKKVVEKNKKSDKDVK